MKKIISIILALAMMLSLGTILPAAAETIAVDEALLGTWILDDMGAEFTFYDDGTYYELFYDMEGNGIYSIVGDQISIDGSEPFDYVIDGDKMVFYDTGMEMSFTRKDSDTANIKEALVGTWILTDISEGSVYDLKVTFFADGLYIVTDPYREDIGSYSVVDGKLCYENAEPEPTILDGDTLTLVENEITLVFTRETTEN